ncbi:MAG: ETS domain-containing protein [Bacteroidales bacterium]|nr:ETS domain-containing protein [Bacteroidales bacterium]
MDKSSWNGRLLRCYAATVEILMCIKQETGYEFKELYSLELLEHKDCPTWTGKDAKSGVIEIGYNHDPEAVAHELGHGFHEKMREKGYPNMFGEKLAEAIRFYVESHLNLNSEWLNNFKNDQNPFIKNYPSLGQFVEGLKRSEPFRNMGWTIG